MERQKFTDLLRMTMKESESHYDLVINTNPLNFGIETQICRNSQHIYCIYYRETIEDEESSVIIKWVISQDY